ncbi:terminase small subunit [Bifidobacterium miconisargentati]|uniref:terminase small subunit n=1 Tax=Bifidobacterium miconisargentati TaxID=2834437 RepID=UPI001BDD4357|nr:hypothetical protein [Bifidobacterium miconisargentati]MBW3090425.1 hypothetical protein [Bifidobacterium miconisargentati]
MTSKTTSRRERFPHETVSEALERSIRNASHLKAKDSAAIAAARELAWRIDNWNALAERALHDANESGKRPAVPQNDNTSLPTFLKYCTSLGLVPEEDKPAKPTRAKATRMAEPTVADEFEEYLANIG